MGEVLKRKSSNANLDILEPSTSHKKIGSESVPRAKRPKAYFFQTVWETEYFVVKNASKTGVVCLICQAKLSGFRKNNCERHYNTHHGNFSNEYPRFSACREMKFRELKGNLNRELKGNVKKEENAMPVMPPCSSIKLSTEVSFAMSKIIAKNSMPYSSGETIKECIVTAMEILTAEIPENQRQMLIKSAKNIPLSNETVTRRVEDIASIIEEELWVDIDQCMFFSLALDRSTNIGSIAQMMCFVRFIKNDGTAEEAFLGVLPLTSRTNGEDMHEILMQYLTSHNVALYKLVSVITDGTPSMMNTNEGLVACLVNDHQIPDFLHYHCLIHNEMICYQLKNGTKIVQCLQTIERVVKSLASKPHNKQLLKVFLKDLQFPNSEYYVHSEIKWISQAKMLARVWEIFEEVKNSLLQTELESFHEIFTDEFKITVSFTVDLFSHLDGLSERIQRRNNIVVDMYKEIMAFQDRLMILLDQIHNADFHQLPQLQKCLSETESKQQFLPFITDIVEDLIDNFSSRVEFLEDHQPRFQLVMQPMSFQADSLSKIFQPEEMIAATLELIALQLSMTMIQRFQQENISKFWGSSECENEFPLLRREAFKVLAMFGSTHMWENTLLLVNNILDKKRSRLTSEHLEECLRVALQNEEVNVKKLMDNIQSQGSH